MTWSSFRSTYPTSKLKSFILKPHKNEMFSLFKIFLKTNIQIPKLKHVVHQSQRLFFININSGGVCNLALTKMYKLWININNLIYNLFFYNINLLFFGNSFFRSEILALNWVSVGIIKTYWRFIRPFLIYKPNKINDFSGFVFSRFQNLGFQLGFILDINYHTKTLFYLKNANFYTLGLIPITSDLYLVDFAIPVNQSLVSYLFFLRFFIGVKRNIKLSNYIQLRKTWSYL